jgi:hypothetical protein
MPSIVPNNAPNWTLSITDNGIFVIELNLKSKKRDLGAIDDCGTAESYIWFEIEKEKVYFVWEKFVKATDFGQKNVETLCAAVKKKLQVPYFRIIFFNHYEYAIKSTALNEAPIKGRN